MEHTRFRFFLLLLLALTLVGSAFAAQPVVVEAPLFEGGAGKEWFLYAARAFEVQGIWDVTISSPNGDAKGKLTVKLLDGPINGDDADLRAMIESNTADPALQSLSNRWGELRRDNSHGDVSAWVFHPNDRKGVTIALTCDSANIRGTIKSDSNTFAISGTKPYPIKMDLTLDPRVDDKVRVRFLEGTFPELTDCVNVNYFPLIREGDIYALDEVLDGPNWEGTGTWRSSFLPGTLDSYSDNGKTYGIPVPEYAFVIWYNKKLFREHHWATPQTWDEFFTLCEQVKKSGVAPLAFQGRYPYYAEPLFYAATYQIGGPEKFYKLPEAPPGTFTAPEVVEAIKLTRKSASFFQDGAMGMSHTESQLQFFLGHTAMIPCGSWLKSEMLGKIPDGFELGCFNLPVENHPKSDPTALQVHVEPFFVSAKAKHPREAAEFLRFATSRRMAARFARMQDIPTAIKGANEGNLSKDLEDLNKIIAGAGVSYGFVEGKYYPEFQQLFRDQMYNAMAKLDWTPEQVAKDFETKAQAARNRAQHPDSVQYNHILAPIALLLLLCGGMLVWVVQLARAAKHRALHPVRHSGLQKMNFGNVLLFVGPAIIVYTLFVIVPCVRSFTWSLHTWNGLTPMETMPFTGLLNFKRLLFEGDEFWISLQNNLFLMIVVPLFVIPLSLFLAASISRGVIGSKFFRVVFFFPNLLGGVAATLLWLHLYNPQGGLVNSALSAIGVPSDYLGAHLHHFSLWLTYHSFPKFYSGFFDSIGGVFSSIGTGIQHKFNSYAWLEPKHLYWALIPISVWSACGFNMVLFLAAMESIPESYYEAATIDGASQFRQFWTITVPLIWEILAIAIVFLVIGGMKAFEIIWLLTNQQPATDNHVVATRMVQAMFNEFKVGESAALAVLLFLMVFVATAATLRGMRRETIEM